MRMRVSTCGLTHVLLRESCVYSVKLGFGNLKSDAGLESLNSYLQDWSYIEG